MIEFTGGATLEITPATILDCLAFSEECEQWYTVYSFFSPDVSLDILCPKEQEWVKAIASYPPILHHVDRMNAIRFKVQDFADLATYVVQIHFDDAAYKIQFEGLYRIPPTLKALVEDKSLQESQRKHYREDRYVLEKACRDYNRIVVAFFGVDKPLIQEVRLTLKNNLCLENVISVDCAETI